MVAVPDGQLRRRLIGVEHLRQGWGRKRAGIARTGRPATGQPTRGTRTPARSGARCACWACWYAGVPRLPYVEVSDDEAAILRHALERHGLLSAV